ncbi:uncharacterized protein LOC131611141 [Vicia villosa]|uniref:uncharacterized protein LOC131611141 n=1 Tax=Vicia villosa TaxID=3911 RepID=UPI00273BF227|nr:uncharacterized protein LOC131611141 [Vicia villosa]
MGMNTSLMRGNGFSTSPVLSLAMNKLYDQFNEKDVKDFEEFHVAILDTFNTINMAVTQKHYDAPSYKDVKEIFNRWKESNEEAREEIFKDFVKKNVILNKVDESMIVTAIVAPPAAMVAKRTGQKTLPQLKFMNAIPDVVFVPSATVLALITVKILRLMFIGNGTTSNASSVDNILPPTRETAPDPSQQNISNTTSESNATSKASSVDNILPPSPETAPDHSLQNVPNTTSESNATQDMIKLSDAHQLTSKGDYCVLCKKVHD